MSVGSRMKERRESLGLTLKVLLVIMKPMPILLKLVSYIKYLKF